MKKTVIFILILLIGFGGWYAWDRYQESQAEPAEPEQAYEIGELPEYSGEPAVDVNGGRPAFADEEITESFYQRFSELDSLGRCGAAEACLDREHMPEGERGEIEEVKPSGWQVHKYDFIDNGGFLFNRCHMIGWQLTGENEEARNLITGTRYFNVEGMLPYENRVASYIRRTKNHVMYRITPVFRGNELVCRGVQMEARSVEDNGEGISFNVFCYNVQPGVEIDYSTGYSHLAEGAGE